MGEFEVIELLRDLVNARPGAGISPAAVGIGDDAALLDAHPGMQLVVTMDTLVAGVHFPLETSPADIGFKSLAVNLSDLAAMGADPAWFFLALTLPHTDREWLEGFACGIGELATRSRIQLAGGDTTRGPLSITVTALGWVPSGEALLRSGARPDDLVVVSGTPGLASLGLWQWQNKLAVDELAWSLLNRPIPRLTLGHALRRKAGSCIDVSDGLAADLGHVARASGVGAEIWLDRLPVHDSLRTLPDEQRWSFQLSGGDDYELCFALPPGLEPELPALSERAGVALTPIGHFTAMGGVRFLKVDGAEFVPGRRGFDHFA